MVDTYSVVNSVDVALIVVFFELLSVNVGAFVALSVDAGAVELWFVYSLISVVLREAFI